MKHCAISFITVVLMGLNSAAGAVIGEHNAATASLTNETLTVQWDLSNGTFDCYRSTGAQIVSNGFSAVQTDEALITSCDERFTRQAEIADSNNNLGSGKTMTMHCHDTDRIMDIDIAVSLYEGEDYFTIEITAVNVSSHNLSLIELQPMCANHETAGGIALTDNPADIRISTSGYFFTDPGTIATFADRPTIASWWNITLLDKQKRNALTAGFITKTMCESYLTARQIQDPASNESFSLETHCTLLMPGHTTGGTNALQPWSRPDEIGFSKKLPVTLKQKSQLNSDLLAVIVGSDPFAVLEKYASLNRQHNNISITATPPMGWSTWPYYYWALDENEILRNADFIAEHLKPYGMEYVQLDGGWQLKAGQWQADETLFPHGMKWLADQIRKRGLKPAIWISPFEIDETTEVFKQHKDWLFKNSDGSLLVVGKAHSKAPALMPKTTAGQVPKVYGLDVTHPEAREWLYRLFKQVTDEWGYEFVKIDWAYTTYAVSPTYYDPTQTKTQAFRLAMQTIRDGIGKNSYLLNCGLRTAMGIGDSTRISADSAATWANISKSNGQARAIGRCYFEHNNLWCNDPDMLMVRAPLTPSQLQTVAPVREKLDKRFAMGGFALEEARALATIVALSGGQFLNGDNLCELSPDRLDILKKVLPVYPHAARPLDYFDTTFPSVFCLSIKKEFEDWDILALFNWTDEPARKPVTMTQSKPNTATTYLAYDFWQEKFLGAFNDHLDIDIKPRSVSLLSIHERTNAPQIISTNRHFTQGAVDLQHVKWDLSTNTLSGISTGIPLCPYTITVYVPSAYKFLNATTSAPEFHTHAPASDILTVTMIPHDEPTMHWQLNFTQH